MSERRERRWWVEVPILLVFYQLYRVVRVWVRGSPTTADRNAVDIVDLEQTLGLQHEETVQDWFLDWEQVIRFFDAYHGLFHFMAVGVAFIVLWRMDRARYRFWRNVFGWMLALGIVGFWVYPITPPRLLPGFVDTAREIGGWGPIGTEPGNGAGGAGNEFAAIPSLHVGWAMWVMLALWALATAWWAKGLLIFHVTVTHVVIVATAKHWIIDAPGAWVTVALAVALEAGRRRWWGRVRDSARHQGSKGSTQNGPPQERSQGAPSSQ